MSTTAEVAERVRAARAAATPLRIVGAGRWLDAGAPCAARERLDIGALAGVVEYEPGDLTLTAAAGTTLAELERVTAAHGQWLPLDPAGDQDGTLGATIATASAGPLASAFGTPRDQVLGCTVVTGTGDVVRAGGRVVKNVAGFDLVRLMIGAWGSLGAITEATVRLRARPEVDESVAIAIGGRDGLERAWRWLRSSEFTPMAAELVAPAMARRIAIGSSAGPLLLLRFGGNEPLVRAARASAARLGDAQPVDTSTWRVLATLERDDDAVLRLSVAPASLPALWQAALPALEEVGGLVRASLSRGVLRCVLPGALSSASTAPLAGMLSRLPAATRVGERLPSALWAPPHSDPVADALNQGIRRAFDPDHLLNPGIMGSIRTGLA